MISAGGSLQAPATLLRIEGAALLVASVAAYQLVDGSWLLFVLLLLAPDIAMAGYLAGPVIGALCYNAAHLTVWPLGLVMGGFMLDAPLAVALGLIWLAHIGLDRALGYGLKLPSGFQDTHLGRIGRRINP